MKGCSLALMMAGICLVTTAITSDAVGQSQRFNRNPEGQADASQRQQSSDQSSQLQRQTQPSGQRPVGVHGGGKVLQMKEVELRGSDTKNLVVLIRARKNPNDKGARRVVDLGPVDKVKELNIQPGTMIWVRGVVVPVGQRQMLMARQVQVGDQSLEIERQRVARREERRTR